MKNQYGHNDEICHINIICPKRFSFRTPPTVHPSPKTCFLGILLLLVKESSFDTLVTIFVKKKKNCAAGWVKMQNLTMCHFIPRNLTNDPWQTIIPALRKVYSTMSYRRRQDHAEK